MTSYYYDLCCQHRGKYVHIHEKTGRRHYGRIADVDRQFVYIEVERSRSELGGFGWGYYSWGYRPFIVPIALAAIGGFLVGSAFFW